MTLGVLREGKKTAGDLTVSKHIIIVPARKTATGPDLTERGRKHRLRGRRKAEEKKDRDRGRIEAIKTARLEDNMNKGGGKKKFNVFGNYTWGSALISPPMSYSFCWIPLTISEPLLQKSKQSKSAK